jgi:hypothetical protein
MEHTHQVQKYALIHSAAGEILAHMEELQTCSDSNSYFHVLQIEKAALFIQFVEDIYVIPGTEYITDSAIKALWNIAQDPESNYAGSNNMQPYIDVNKKVNEHQKKINGKFLSISPF